MKEITRIHIAKTPYEIETAAKKDLEAYIASLEAYKVEVEIIEDIEVRITEILAERGVKKDGIVSVADVKALKKQLGAPEDFMADGDIAVGPDDIESDGGAARKLYRDADNAVIGGVLAGIAAFFKVNPMWVRLVFIILALASFGTMILVYAVLWIAVPEAKTAADRLQMAGRPVTVKSIRDLNANDATKSVRSNIQGRRILTVIVGIMCTFAALAAAVATIGGTVVLLVHGDRLTRGLDGGFGSLRTAACLLIVSGLLFIALTVLGAYASFAQKLSRRVIVSAGIVTVLGLASFSTAVGLAQYGSWQRTQEIQKNTHESTLQLPDDIRTATSLVADTPGMTVEYVVAGDGEDPHAATRLFAYGEYVMPKITATVKNGVLTVKSDKPAEGMCAHMWCDSWTQKVTVYGPALTNIDAQENVALRYHARTQKSLAVNAARKSDVTVESGVIDNLQIDAKDDASVSAADASVSHAVINSVNADAISLGTVKSVQLNDNDSCPANSMTSLDIWNIASDTIEVNGTMKPTNTTHFACAQIRINSKENR